MPNISDADIDALRSSGRFDSDFYRTTYPDVRESGLEPAAHFLWLGARLGRLAAPPCDLLKTSSADVLDVLFVDGTNGTSSTPYRVERVAAGLVGLGARVRCIRGDQLGRLLSNDLSARYVLFFRAPLLGHYRKITRELRAAGSKIVFDIDDLIFEEEQIPNIDGYRYLTDQEKVGYVMGVRAYREFLLYADFCTAPTEFLADRARLLGKKSFRVRNSIDPMEIERFRGASPRGRDGKFVVGYYSGSKTHQADFRQAGEALGRFMAEEPSVEFRLVGHLDLREFPALFRREGPARVTRIDLMPHREMLEDQLKCDVIIAPLEVGNPFCEAKSELKFFEASLARRPVIASATNTFRLATNNGELAQLANSAEEWLACFGAAFAHRERFAAVAERARDVIVAQYSSVAAGNEALAAYACATS